MRMHQAHQALTAKRLLETGKVPVYQPLFPQKLDDEPHELEQREVLKATGKEAICLMDQKRKVLKKALAERQYFLSLLVEIDDCRDTQHTNLVKIFDENLKSFKPTDHKLNNEALSKAMVILFNLYSAIQEDYPIISTICSQNTDRRNTRSKTQEHENFIFAFDDLREVMEKVNKKVMSDRRVDAEPNPLLRSLPMTEKEGRRTYLESYSPTFSAFPGAEYSRCLFCQHNFVDFPTSNESVKKVEEEIWSGHRELLDAWDKYVASKGTQSKVPPPKTKKGKPFTCEPAAPTNLPEFLLCCHCRQLQCTRRPAPGAAPDQLSTCPIGCKKENGEQYEWVDGACSCPICKCQCNMLYSMARIPEILVLLQQRQTNSDKDDPNFHANEDGKAKWGN